MRVIAGSARRLPLVAPKGMTTRPTGDKIKETLFNILAPYLYDIGFLDLFAGSGAIGIEALSRGAKSCTFVEKSKEAADCIRKNLETTHFTDKADIRQSDVLSVIHTLHPSSPYGIVFMDPPYGKGLEKEVLRAIAGADIIDDETMIIVEEESSADLSYVGDMGLEVFRVKEYRNSKHVFIRRMEGG